LSNSWKLVGSIYRTLDDSVVTIFAETSVFFLLRILLLFKLWF
jgi:hypothetical protein